MYCEVCQCKKQKIASYLAMTAKGLSTEQNQHGQQN